MAQARLPAQNPGLKPRPRRRSDFALTAQIVGKETYTAKDTDFSAILTKISAAKPDLVYLPDYYNVVNLAVKQAKEKGIKVPLTGGA